jgi:uncharacterized membrane protein
MVGALARAVGLATLAATALLTGYALFTLPPDAVLTVHWGIDGVANGFAGKEALLIMPLVTLLVVGVIALAIRFDPKRKNIVRSRDAVSMVLAALALILGAAQLAIVRSGFGATDRLDSIVLVLLGLLFLTLGYAMPQIRQNYTIGMRLPWTIESEKAWDASHRFIGKAWMLLGVLVTVLGALSWSLAALGVFFVGLVVSVCGGAIVAYRTWSKKASKKRRKARRA